MAALGADAERLNNAIYSLATLNPQLSVAVSLNGRWQDWYERAGRNPGILESPGILRTFANDYAAARRVAPNLSERTPPADTVQPEPYRTSAAVVDAAAAAAGEVVRSFAAYAAIGAGAVVAAWVLLGRSRS